MASTIDDLLTQIRNQEDSPISSESAEMDDEMRHYLDKLKEIVPKCPKHRRVPRLELIQHVIDYICDLQRALEDRSLRDLAGAVIHHTNLNGTSTPPMNRPGTYNSRQPLGTLPVPLLENLQASSSYQEQLHHRSNSRQSKDHSESHSPASRQNGRRI